jgi:excisionase family DNA binding protein
MNTIKSLDELEHQLNPLSVKEAARLYGESAATFYRKVRRGEIPGVFRDDGKSRGRIKICPKEFVAWLKSKMTRSGASQNGGNDNKVV